MGEVNILIIWVVGSKGDKVEIDIALVDSRAITLTRYVFFFNSALMASFDFINILEAGFLFF
jgi:hypothetical protein